MPFEKGNEHGRRAKVWASTLSRAIAQDNGLRLRAAAEELLDQAAKGERWAIIELADRLDGKAQQSIEVSGEVSYQPFLSAAEKLKAKIKGEAIDVDTIESSDRTVTLAVAHAINDQVSTDEENS
jgi:divalent metal cation (Fe/Co/Zn/Cd) transporter